MGNFARLGIAVAALLLPAAAAAADAQNPIDRSDPAVAAEELGERERPANRSDTPALPPVAAPAPSAPAVQPFVVGAVRVEGAVAIPPAAFAPAIEPWLGRRVGREELAALARDVAEVARRAGYGLATAWVPPQTVENGVLRIRVEEGRVDAVEVEGPGRAAARARLAPLADGRPVTTARLERQLLLAGDLPGIRLDRPRLVRRDGRNVLTVSATRKPVEGRAWMDNWGSDPVGPVRAGLSIDFNGPFGSADRLSLGAVATPLQPEEFQLIHGRYSAPLDAAGTEMSVRGYAGRTEPGGDLQDEAFEGLSWEAAAAVSHPLVRSRAASLWGMAELALRDSRLDQAGVPVRDDRITAATGSLFASGQFGGGWLRGRLGLTRGLDLFGATRAGDPLASRPDASGVFTKLDFQARWDRPLGGGLTLALAGEGQLSAEPLLASEEMGLGGREFLRAFDYREFAGDRGAAAFAELRYELPSPPLPAERVQFYLYGDAGRVTNLEEGFGGGSLASAGGGLRVWLAPRIDAGAELGLPLTDGALDSDPAPRFSFTLGIRF